MFQRILLAGPNSAHMTDHAQMLLRQGYDIRTTNTGLACLEVLRDWQPDLMVMDPDINWGSGAGVIGVMYEESDISAIPVILLVDDHMRARAELRPEWQCRLLHRSINPLYLLQMINDLLGEPHVVEA